MVHDHDEAYHIIYQFVRLIALMHVLYIKSGSASVKLCAQCILVPNSLIQLWLNWVSLNHPLVMQL